METTAAPTCTTCGKTFKNKLGLSGHMRSHKQPATANIQPVAQPAEQKAEAPLYDHNKYRELPAPVIEHLEKTFGDWLKHFEIGQEWKPDYGGYGMYIKIPKQYSTEWKEVTTPVYDNVLRKQVGERTIVQPDIRWKPIKEIADVIRWIDLVRENVTMAATRKGLVLPATNIGMDQSRITT